MEAARMADDLDAVKVMLNQLLSQSIAQGAMLNVLCCECLASHSDWGKKIDDVRTAAEWSINAVKWSGSRAEGETIRSQALAHLLKQCDEIRSAILREKRGEPRTSNR
jgi:hypothetical protein